ncbi:substrate-binding domain-containing protein [Ruegeria hyattellae]|uniref:substrate-binding domain-containing protein n=1 Tax=Ruegeria hyattellae TaxID=3233337 RepID=UPI00355B94D9
MPDLKGHSEIRGTGPRDFAECHHHEPPQLERPLLNNELNIAIGTFRQLSAAPKAETVYVERQLLCCGPAHPAFDLQEGREVEQAVAKAKYSERSFDDRDMHQAQGLFSSAAKAATMEAILGMVLSGLYLGYLPQHACKPWIERGELKSLFSGNLRI